MEIENNRYAGGYRLGRHDNTYTFMFDYKPIFIHRFFMKLLLGFEWVDGTKEYLKEYNK